MDFLSFLGSSLTERRHVLLLKNNIGKVSFDMPVLTCKDFILINWSKLEILPFMIIIRHLGLHLIWEGQIVSQNTKFMLLFFLMYLFCMLVFAKNGWVYEDECFELGPGLHLTSQSVPISHDGCLPRLASPWTLKCPFLFIYLFFLLLFSQVKRRKVTLACCRTNFNTLLSLKGWNVSCLWVCGAKNGSAP